MQGYFNEFINSPDIPTNTVSSPNEIKNYLVVEWFDSDSG